MGNSPSAAPAAFNHHPPDEAESFRHAADAAAQERNLCYQQSQAAWKSGDRGKAKQLSEQGKAHDKRMQSLNKQAGAAAFKARNTGRPQDEIDLHGLQVAEAKQRAEEALVACKAKGLKHVTFIVGKGLHSKDGIPKLKPAINELIEKHNLRCTPNKPNAGCLFVEFVSPEEKGWFEKLVGCIIC